MWAMTCIAYVLAQPVRASPGRLWCNLQGKRLYHRFVETLKFVLGKSAVYNFCADAQVAVNTGIDGVHLLGWDAIWRGVGWMKFIALVCRSDAPGVGYVEVIADKRVLFQLDLCGIQQR